jgi:tetratricopeptide (TPR) repeat protein
VIHRDIKPHNLILTPDGTLKITDFGLARVAEQPGVTLTGELLGSPLYMSPEQILAGPNLVDHRTDIYSLGATMYEWLTHQPPYPGETRERVISLIANSEPAPPRALAPDVPVDLETICLKAIARNVDHRYQTAADFREDLRRFLSSRPIRAKRASAVTRVGKFIGRHQVASVAVTAVLIAGALGWALISSRGEAQYATEVAEHVTAAATEQEVEIDQLLDLLVHNVLPAEIGKPISAAGAAMPMVQDLVRSSQAIVTAPGTLRSDGANPGAAGTPAGIARRALRDFYEAVRSDQEVAAQTAEDEYAPFLQRALELWGQDKDEDAVTFLNVYLEKRPDNLVALRLRMVLLGLLGRYPDMAADADTLVRLHSDDPAVYVWRGLAGLFLNQFDRSLADLERAAGFEEVSAWAEVVAGLALTWIGNPAEAIGHLDVALGRTPDLVVALLARATAYAAFDDKGSAVDDVTRVIEIEPDNADALAVRGLYYATIGQFAAVANDLKHAMDLAGRSPEMNLLWGIARAQQRNLEAAASTGETPPEETAAETGSETEADTLSNERVQEWFSRYVYPRSPDASAQDSISPSPRP